MYTSLTIPCSPQTINLSVRPSPLPRPPNPGIATYSSPGRRPRPLICPSDRRRCPDPQTQEWLHTAPQAAGGRPWHVLGRSWPLLGPCWASRGGPQRLQKSSREAILGGNLEGRFGNPKNSSNGIRRPVLDYFGCYKNPTTSMSVFGFGG